MQDIIKLYIYDGYDKNIITFLNVICGICKKKRKLYLLKSGHTPMYHGDFKLLKYFIYSMLCILFQFKNYKFFVHVLYGWSLILAHVNTTIGYI